MSDVGDNTSDVEEFLEDELESSDDEEIIEENVMFSDTSINKLRTDNKFYNIVMENCKNPTKFHVHSLIAHRYHSLKCGAQPLVEVPQSTEIVETADQIDDKIFQIVLKEIEEDKSPMLYLDNITMTYRSISYLHKDLVLKIAREAYELARC